MIASKRLWMVTLALLAAGTLGCAKSEAPAGSETAHTEAEHEHEHQHATKSGHSHDGWWCDEHGVPEHVCGLCDSKLAAGFQKKGDWCKEHDRPDSQCFACHPEFEARFAAQYEAKYGKKPPKPEG